MRFSKLFIIIIFCTVIFFHSDGTITQDLGRHLTLGKIIWQSKYVPDTNLFSYTYPDFPFINHHWGSEVIFYLGNSLFSINGLIIFKIIIVTTAFLVLSRTAMKKSDNIAILIGSFLALEILRERTEIRPEIFGCLFLSLFLTVLYQEKIKETKWIWILPLIMVFWLNMHVTFVFGVVVFFLFLLDRTIEKKLKKKYFILGSLILLSLLFNPFGWQGAIYPLSIFHNYGYSIVENQSPFFLEKFGYRETILYFKIATFLLLLTTPFLLLKRYYFETGITLVFGVLSLQAIRHFPFFALSLIYTLPLGLTFLKEKIMKLLPDMRKNMKSAEIAISIFVIGLILVEIYSLSSNSYYKNNYSPIRFGLGQVKGLREAVDFFQRNNLPGPIFNNFDIGSYLIYRLYPKEKIFIDGRPEAYPASFIQNIYIPMQEKEEIWQKYELEYGFKTIIFSHTDITPWARNFLKRILHDQKWTMVYFDDFAVVLVKKDAAPKNPSLDTSEEKTKNLALAEINHAQDPDKLMRLGNFFDLAGFADLTNMTEIKLRKINSIL